MTVHDLVPYLKDTNGQHHNFGHTINTFAFESDDEYDMRKKNVGTEMKKRLGIDVEPLVGTEARVCTLLYSFLCLYTDLSFEFRHSRPNTCSSTS